MTCTGCKHYKHTHGRKPVCEKYRKDEPVRCLDFRHKQGQRVK